MRLHASGFLAALAVISTERTSEASTCKSLVDSDSTLVKSLTSWTKLDLSNIDFPYAFTEIDTALPWLSKCAAAIDPYAVYISLASSTTLKNAVSSLESLDVDLSTRAGWSSMCSKTDDLLSSVDSIISESIMDAFDSTNGCCDDFLSEFKTLFGGDALKDMLIKLLQLSANIVCSERKYTNLEGDSTTERCGFSIFKSFTFINKYDDPTSMLMNLAQIPNDQMCSVFAGKEFTNTKGATVTIGFGTNGVDPMGICLEPVDTLIQYLKSWGIFSETIDADGTMVLLSDFFTSGKSIRGNLPLDYATTTTSLPRMGMRATEKILLDMGVARLDDGKTTRTFLQDWFVGALAGIKSYGRTMLLHLPNNGGCTYSDQSITLAYEDISITGSSAGSNSTTTPTSTGTSGANAAVEFASMVSVGAALLSLVAVLL